MISSRTRPYAARAPLVHPDSPVPAISPSGPQPPIFPAAPSPPISRATPFRFAPLVRSPTRHTASGRAHSTSSQPPPSPSTRSEEHTSELQSRGHLVCRLLLEKKKKLARNHLPYLS